MGVKSLFKSRTFWKAAAKIGAGVVGLGGVADVVVDTGDPAVSAVVDSTLWIAIIDGLIDIYLRWKTQHGVTLKAES